MTAGAVSRRYARALVEAVAEAARAPGAPPEAAGEGLDAVGRELGAFAGVLRARDVRAFFANPGVQRRDKEAVLRRLAGGLELGPVTTTFLGLLLEKGRLGHLEAVARTYRDLVDERLGRARVEVTSAAPLEAATQARLAERLAAVTGKAVLLEARTEPALLGGLVARVGGTVYDGSLRAQLGRLRQQMLRGPGGS